MSLQRSTSECFFNFSLDKQPLPLDDEEDEELKDGLSGCLSSSSELTVSSIVSSSSSNLEDECQKSHVSFNTAVAMRVVYYSSDEEEGDDSEESVDSVIQLKKEDNSKPCVEPVVFDEEEEAIRKQLVGCISATKRKRPNFAAMYGCGESLDDDDDDVMDDNFDDDDFEFKEPTRVIVCTSSSATWFNF